MDAGEIIELLIRGLPYPDQMRKIDINIAAMRVEFDWRGGRYCVDTNGNVEEMQYNSLLVTSDGAILMQKCLDAALSARKAAA